MTTGPSSPCCPGAPSSEYVANNAGGVEKLSQTPSTLCLTLTHSYFQLLVTPVGFLVHPVGK